MNKLESLYITVPNFIRNMDEDVLIFELNESINELQKVEDEIDKWYQNHDENDRDSEIIEKEIHTSELNDNIQSFAITLAYKNKNKLKENFPTIYENLIERM
jgi:hypothetical protein